LAPVWESKAVWNDCRGVALGTFIVGPLWSFKRAIRTPYRDATHATQGGSEDCDRDTVVPNKYLTGQGHPATLKLLAASTDPPSY